MFPKNLSVGKENKCQPEGEVASWKEISHVLTICQATSQANGNPDKDGAVVGGPQLHWACLHTHIFDPSFKL